MPVIELLYKEELSTFIFTWKTCWKAMISTNTSWKTRMVQVIYLFFSLLKHYPLILVLPNCSVYYYLRFFLLLRVLLVVL